MEALGAEYALDVQAEREPKLSFDTDWVQEYANQKALLDCFAGHLRPQESLCFFYAKQVPFVESPGASRILIGVGRVLHVSPCVEYNYTTNSAFGLEMGTFIARAITEPARADYRRPRA